jgi:hypothetical protein
VGLITGGLEGRSEIEFCLGHPSNIMGVSGVYSGLYKVAY